MGNPLVLICNKPIDRTDPAVPVVVDTAVFKGYVFDRAVQTELTDETFSGTLVLPVADTAGFVSAQQVELRGDDGSRHLSTVDAILSATSLSINDITTANTGIGARLIRH